MNKGFVMGLLASLFALLGCGPDERTSEIQWQGDRRTANPPPKPPNCPDLPELANVTRPDGSIIDVRIIQVDEVKFYVPTNWNRWKETLEGIRPTPGTALGRYDPDINAVECPGVVHQFVSKRATFGLGWRFVLRRFNTEPRLMKPNFSVDTKVDILNIARPHAAALRDMTFEEKFADKIIDWPTDQSTSAQIIVVPDHLIARYRWPRSKPVGSPEWEAVREDVLELVEWLRTPPVDRDNDRIFALGAR